MAALADAAAFATACSPAGVAAMKAGLATAIGAFSGTIYTSLYGRYADAGTPPTVWYVLAGHLVAGVIAMMIFQKVAGGFVQQEE